MSLTDTEIQELFQIMESKFQADKAADLNTVIQFQLTGDVQTNYAVHIKDQTAQVTEGVSEAATTTFIANAEDYADIVHGRTNAMQAFMQGKLKVKGDMQIAMKLQAIFGL